MKSIWQHSAVSVLIIVLGMIGYGSVFQPGREFVNYDDADYVTKQSGIQSLDVESVIAWFDTSRVVAGNYHPVTMISLTLNHAMSGYEVSAYIGTNVALHIANSLLVYWMFVFMFPGRMLVAAAAAVWMCVHPMHVESVAWISERKDVLYTFFLLVSVIAYLYYTRDRRWLAYGICLFAFLLSCLSKAMAVPLPFVLLAFDYFLQRKDVRRAVVEKLPFFAFSIVIGLLAIQSQQTVGALTLATPWGDRLLYAAWGLVMYLGKLFLPFGLTVFYARPALPGQPFPFDFYIAPVLIALVASGLWFYLRQSPDIRRHVFMGSVFFVSMIALVLQLLPVGSAIAAERYTYVPYIGAFIVLMPSIDQLSLRARKSCWAVIALLTALFLNQTVDYVARWRNSATLWTNAIDNYDANFFFPQATVSVNPFIAKTAYLNRGLYYRSVNKVEQAIADLEVSRLSASTAGQGFELRPINTVILGSLYRSVGDYQRSIPLIGEGLTQLRAERLASVGSDTDYSEEQYVFMCRTYVEDLIKLRRFTDVIDFVSSYEQDLKRDAISIAARGVAYGYIGNHALAIDDLRRSLAIDPSQDFIRANLVTAFRALNLPDSAAAYHR